MANAITIRVSLDTADVRRAAGEVQARVKSALDGAVSSAGQAGRSLGNNLRAGFQSALDRIPPAAKEAFSKVADAARQAGNSAGDALGNGLKGALSGINRQLLSLISITAIVAGFKELITAAIESAIAIDKSRQTIGALVGGIDAANRKLTELRKLANETPGLTASLAANVYAQLKAASGLADESINRFLRSFGRLNAVFNIEDQQGFVRNLTQIFTQGFERADIKEALGRVPIFNQILEAAFGTSDPDKLRKLQESGQLTIDAYFDALSRAIRDDARFATVRESLGVQFEKARDNILFALGPLGDELARLLLPFLQEIGRQVSEASDAIAGLARDFQLLGGAVSPVIGLINSLYSAFDQLLGGALPNSLRDLVNLLRAIPFGAVGGLFTNAQAQVDAQRDAARGRLNRALSSSEQSDLFNFIAGRPSASAGRAAPPIRRSSSGSGRARGSRLVDDPSDRIEERLNDLLERGNAIRARRAEFTRTATVDLSKQLEVVEQLNLAEESLARQTEARNAAAADFSRLDSELRVKELQIQNAINAGVLTETEGRKAILAVQREQRDAMIAALEAQREFAQTQGDQGQIQRLNEQIEGLRGLGVELNNTQRFLRGIGSEAEDIGDIFERFGRNVANSFRSIKGVFDGLKNAVKSFFADLLGNSLQNLLKNTLGVLFGGRAAAGGAGGGGIGAIFGGIGNLFGGGAAGGGGFATGGFAGGGGAASILSGGGGGGGLLGGLGSLFGGGISAPASLGGLPSILRPTVFNPALGGAGGKLGGLGGLFGNVFGGLGSLFKGIGFGKAGGTGGALASALPLLGVSLGAGLGGSSGLGQILGGVGGGLLGVGLTAAPASLGALGFLAPLFSNPITAIVGAALLPAAFLLGRAKQRGKDERASGDFLQQAIDAIRELRAGVESGSVSGAQARQIFESQILGTFIQQVNTLKTKSVRESRLTNQVRDLRNLFEAEVVPAIALAKSKGTVNDKLIPEFATGGFKSGTGLALLHHGEAILNTAQQSRLSALAGPNVLQAIGVPNAATNAPAPTPAFAAGGVFRSEGPMVIELSVNVGLSDDDARQITIAGARTADGRDVIVRTVRAARRDGEL